MTQKAFVFPPSFAQQRLWFFDQLEPGNPAYNLYVAVRLFGALDKRVLAASLTEIVRRHEVLRTTIPAVNGQPMQVIGSGMPVSLSVTDLRRIKTDEREREVRLLAATEARKSFDLARGPLIRLRLFQLADEEYVLVLTIHHAVMDGWSLGILFGELTAIYGALANGRPSPLPELPIQYADFAVWQRQYLQGEILERQLAYWRQQLADAPAALDLPMKRPRPLVKTFRGSLYPFDLPAELSESLKGLSRREGATFFMTLLAAFQVLLCRYSGQTDIVVGTPIAGRNRAEIETLIGFFVNTLALRTDLGGNPTFRELLRRVRETCLHAYQHQDVPFDKLVEELQPRRSLRDSPFFQVFFVLQNTAPPNPSLPGIRAVPFDFDNGTAKFDLLLAEEDRPEGLHASLEYSTDLFDEATIARMARHYQILLEGIVADPERCLSELPLLTAAERQQAITQWNATERDYPTDQCVHQLFEAQVERTPNAVAVLFEDQRLTYRELNQRANRLAHYLRRLGVGPEDLVAICSTGGLESVIGPLGILKAGGAYLTIDPNCARESLLSILRRSKPRVLLTREDLLGPFGEYDGTTVCLNRDQEAILSENDQNLPVELSSDHLACVDLGSPVTEESAGMMNTHRGIRNRLSGIQETCQLTSKDCVLQTAGCVDAPGWEFLVPLVAGAHLVLSTTRQQEAPTALLGVMNENKVTILHCAPSEIRQLLETDGLAACPAVRYVFCDALPLFESRAGVPPRSTVGPRVFYGCAESFLDATFLSLEGRAVLRGRPIANGQAQILDISQNAVPVGVLGELCVAGGSLPRGFLNSPDLTADRFIPNRLGGNLGERLYCTRIWARYLADGSIEMSEQDGARSTDRSPRIVPQQTDPTSDQHEPALGHRHVAPRTTVEEVIAGIWREVLGLQQISVHDMFFDLGGHSLLATQILSRLREAFQVEVPLRRLFEGPTIAELATAVEDAVKAEIMQLPDSAVANALGHED